MMTSLPEVGGVYCVFVFLDLKTYKRRFCCFCAGTFFMLREEREKREGGLKGYEAAKTTTKKKKYKYKKMNGDISLTSMTLRARRRTSDR
jgi:hypothetical protein